MYRLGFLTLLLALVFPASGWAELPAYSWTMLIPDNDSRPADVRAFDEYALGVQIANMNDEEKIFHNHLIFQKMPISQLLNAHAPFCELDFDSVRPQVLTPAEKTILTEYIKRGGFLELCQDVYPYLLDDYWKVKSWPVIDFALKELPASDPGFSVERIDEKHLLFHQYYQSEIGKFERLEIKNNPYCPDFILISYKGHPCIFIYGNYFEDDKGRITLARPFTHIFQENPESYTFDVNLYVYATMH